MDNMVRSKALSIYKGKRVLITGDTGFKGSWLSLWLSELGADVVGFALPPERKNDHFNTLGLEKIVHHVNGDIRDLSLLQPVCSEFKPEFLFHLAAQSLVRRSYEDPKTTFDTNLGGSVNILEAVKSTPSLRTLIYVTSDKCYKNKEWIWGYRENDELGGRDPYSASKAAAELVFSSYMDSFFKVRQGFGAASVRAGNVIGGGDWSEDRIVPDSIKSLIEAKPLVLRNPGAVRPWQHVLDPLSGYLCLAANLYSEPQKYSGSWNFGPGGESVRTVHDLAGSIVRYWGEGEVLATSDPAAPHEATLLQLNCDKASCLLGWNPRWGFNKSVAETVSWYKELVKGQPSLSLTLGQIRNYMGDRA